MKFKDKARQYGGYVKNLLIPALLFGFVTGAATAVAVTFYKLCAKYVVKLSMQGYAVLRDNLYYIPIVIVGLFLVSVAFHYIYEKFPNIKGGGISTSIAILRGIITFKWLRSLIGTFVASLVSFLLGVPLGTEGPAVQIGTSIGRGGVKLFGKKHRAWDRYSMTGGACAGFSVATGAPISGIMFALEEAHQRISPNIIMVASSSVMFSNIISKIISPIFGVSETLFEIPTLPILNIYQYWIPVVIGLLIGIFSMLFLRYYSLVGSLVRNALGKIPGAVKMFAVLVLTMIAGIVSSNYISTGHDLIIELFANNETVWTLALILLIRATLTVCANVNGLTGGTFLPVLALGALVASIIGEGLLALGVDSELYTTILVLGITACISGGMKMPITAIVFSVEALSCYSNIISVIIVSFISFSVTELLDVESINDVALEVCTVKEEAVAKIVTIDTCVTVQQNAFAIGRQIRDIFWPHNLFVLSVRHGEEKAHVDQHGGREIREGDILHVRYSTWNEEETREELIAIVGEQEISKKVTENV